MRVPIFFAEEVRHVPVEIQFRTIAMDFWASLEHTIRYKKDLADDGFIAEELAACAASSTEWDAKMSRLMFLVEERKKREKQQD